MDRKQAKSAFSLLALSVAIIGQTGSASAQTTAITLNRQVPIAFDVFVPCANAGAGELVSLSGTLHELFGLTLAANGTILRLVSLEQPQRVSGFGQTSGAIYRGTGSTQEMSNANVSTHVNNFRIIGEGSSSNFLVHQVFHITVNTEGEPITIVDFVSVECH